MWSWTLPTLGFGWMFVLGITVVLLLSPADGFWTSSLVPLGSCIVLPAKKSSFIGEWGTCCAISDWTHCWDSVWWFWWSLHWRASGQKHGRQLPEVGKSGECPGPVNCLWNLIAGSVAHCRVMMAEVRLALFWHPPQVLPANWGSLSCWNL